MSQALEFIESIDSVWKGHETFAFWLVKRLKPKTIVDLGFDRGFSTLAFAYRNRGHVYAIDWFHPGGYAAKSFAFDIAFRNITGAITLGFVKNIHLILSPFEEISKTWKRKIDVLHIDEENNESAKKQYDNWREFINAEAVILVYCPGKFFDALQMPKCLFPQAKGLGVASQNEALIQEIKQKFLSL